MTKTEWANAVNEVIANERNEFAAQSGARAFIRESDGALVYVDARTPRKNERKINLQELFGLLHGVDIRALNALRAA